MIVNLANMWFLVSYSDYCQIIGLSYWVKAGLLVFSSTNRDVGAEWAGWAFAYTVFRGMIKIE